MNQATAARATYKDDRREGVPLTTLGVFRCALHLGRTNPCVPTSEHKTTSEGKGLLNDHGRARGWLGCNRLFSTTASIRIVPYYAPYVRRTSCASCCDYQHRVYLTSVGENAHHHPIVDFASENCTSVARLRISSYAAKLCIIMLHTSADAPTSLVNRGPGYRNTLGMQARTKIDDQPWFVCQPAWL